MNKQIYIFLTFLLLAIMSTAQETVSQNEAVQMARKFISNKIQHKANDSTNINVIVNGLDTILYEVIIENKSIILPGIKSCRPILAYLDNPRWASALDSASLAANGHGYFIRKYINQIINCIGSGNNSEIHPDWNLVESKTADNGIGNDTIGPFLMVTPVRQDVWQQRWAR